jgi:release factor glutamine methyltransferase
MKHKTSFFRARALLSSLHETSDQSQRLQFLLQMSSAVPKKKPTPDYSHVTDLHDPRFNGKVYPPEADSFLFLDALDLDADFINSVVAPTTVLEIGVGSGIVATHCCRLILRTACCCFGVDLSRIALEATALTWQKTAAAAAARPFLNLLQSSGVDAIRPSSIDLILFNPPYVPTSTEEMLAAQNGAITANDELPAAWAGGIAGREVCDRILRRLPTTLSYPHGVAYVVALKENDVPGMLNLVNEAALVAQPEQRSAGPPRVMKVTTVVSRWTGEHLRVLRFEFATSVDEVNAALRAVVEAAGAGEDEEGDDDEEEEGEAENDG